MGKILTGKAKGSMAVIPRIEMIPSESLLSFMLKRRQLPIIVSYAMTIHKAQRQLFDHVDVYLPEPVFTHEQLYVALSRIRDSKNLRVYLPASAKGRTLNIVYKALLTGKNYIG